MLLALKLIGQAPEPMRQSRRPWPVLGALKGEPVLAAARRRAGHLGGAFEPRHRPGDRLARRRRRGRAPLAAAPRPRRQCRRRAGAAGGQTGAPPAARRVPLGNLVMRGIGALSLPAADRAGAEPARPHRRRRGAARDQLPLAVQPRRRRGLPALTEAGVAPDRAHPARAPAGEDPGAAALPRPGARPPGRGARLRGARDAPPRRSRRRHAAPDDGRAERDDPKLVREIERADDAVDKLHEAIKLYLIE